MKFIRNLFRHRHDFGIVLGDPRVVGDEIFEYTVRDVYFKCRCGVRTEAETLRESDAFIRYRDWIQVL